MIVHGWGNYSKLNSEVFFPDTLEKLRLNILMRKSLIARGLGRSYGDSANNKYIIQTSKLKKIFYFDKLNGSIECESGVSIYELNELTIKEGWFVPVTPGSSYVTLGGALASDIHGKNHHLVGSFSQHILHAQLILANGEIIEISHNKNTDLFNATCGGMGLTGIIYSIKLKLKSISSSNIIQTTIKTETLEETIEQFKINRNSEYSVAWLDCATSIKNCGRGLLFLGQHQKNNTLTYKKKKVISFPINISSKFLNSYSIKLFNYIYYHKNFKKKKTNILNINDYFYPLDSINNWYLLYGPKGFIQYQFVIPLESSIKTIKEIFYKIYLFNQVPYLTTLKKFGPKNDNYLSFPMEGITVAFDFKATNKIKNLIKSLDEIIVNNKGRVYLTKDTLMEKEVFIKYYKSWDKFEKVREKYGAKGKFFSNQSIRLGLK